MTPHNQDYRDIFLQSELGQSVTDADVRDTLGFLDSWEDRYRFIIDLGRQLGEFPEALRHEDNILHGCQSVVWLDYYYDSDTDRLYFKLDSQAHIVRGLGAVVLAACNGKSAAQVGELDFEGYLEEIALMRHISPTRGNGLRSMINKIRAVADRLREA